MKTSTYICGLILGLLVIAVEHEVRIKTFEDERVRVDRVFRHITELRVDVDRLKSTNVMEKP